MQAGLLQSLQHKRIQIATTPCVSASLRDGWSLQGLERPVILIFGPLLNPALQQLLLSCGEGLVEFRRRHVSVRIGRQNALHQQAFGRLARNDGPVSDRCVPLDYVPLPFPRWHGESLSGERLVVLAEGGLGDIIQFKDAQIVDWMYLDDGAMKGNYTVCALLKREPKAESA